MLENKTKHTFIVTVDLVTAKEAGKDPILLSSLQSIVYSFDMRLENGKTLKDGIYFKKTIEV